MIDVSQALAELHTHKSHVELAIQSLEALSYSTTNQKRRGRPPKAVQSLANVIAMTNGKHRGRPAGSKNAVKTLAAAPARKKRTFTPAQRKEQAKRMKAYWAAKKKAS